MAESGRIVFTITVDNQGKPVISEVTKQIGDMEKAATGATGGMSSGFASLWKSMAVGQMAAQAVAAGFREIKEFLGSSVIEAMAAEAAQSKLTATINELGLAGSGVRGKIEELSNALVKSTTITDDEVYALSALALNMGVNKDAIGKVVEGAIGLSKVYGIDMTRAMRAAAAAAEGNTASLTRYLPELKDTKNESEKLRIVQESMARGFKIATAEVNTAAGQMKMFENNMQELKESVGGAILGVILPYLKQFSTWFSDNRAAIASTIGSIIENFAELVKILIEVGKAVVWMGKAFIDVVNVLRGLSPVVNGIVEGWQNLLILFTNQLGDVYDKLGESIVREAAQTENSIKRFREAAQVAGINSEEIRKLSERYKEITDVGSKHEKMLRDLIKSHPELSNKLREAAIAGAGVSTSTKNMNDAFTANIPEVKKTTEAHKLLIDQFIKENSIWAQMQSTMKLVPGALKDNEFATEKLTQAEKELYLQLLQLSELIPGFNFKLKTEVDILAEGSEKTKKWTLDWKDANEVMEFAKSIMNEVKNALSGLGIELGPIGEGFFKAAEGATAFVQGLLSGNPLAVIGGAIQMVTGFVNALAEAFGAVNQAAVNANVAMATASMEAAKALNMPADEKMMNTQKTMGEAFNDLLNKAKALGTEGSAAMIGMFEKVKASGIQVKEINDYIAAQMASGLAGYKQMRAAMDPGDLQARYKDLVESMKGMEVGSTEYKKAAEELKGLKTSIADVKNAQAAFGGMNIKVYEDIIKYENKVKANPALTSAISGATEALIGLSNTTRLSEGQFDQFEKSAASAMGKLTKQGFSSKEAYQQMAPMLTRLKFLHEEYGLTLDASTQKMLDGAAAAGVNTDQAMTQEEAFTRMTGALEQLVTIFGGTLPEAVGATTGALSTAASAMGGITGTSGADSIVKGLVKNVGAATGTIKDTGAEIGMKLAEGIGGRGFVVLKKAVGDFEGTLTKSFGVDTKAVGDFEGSIESAHKCIAVLPKSMESITKQTEDIFGKSVIAINKFSNQIDNALKARTLEIAIDSKGGIITKKPDIFAAGGYYTPALQQDTVIQAHRGERVNISQPGQASNQGGNTWNMTFNIADANNPISAAENIKIALNGNLRGVRSKIVNLRS